jgi:hypothetical protein
METTVPNAILQNATGAPANVDKNTLEPDNRAITDVDQIFQVSDTLINDWKKGILNAATITSKVNGQRPYNTKRMKDALMGWKTNISTGFLATECAKVQPRFFMPIKTAKYLTAASLPADWPQGDEKTQYFRQCITEEVRSWPKFNFYIRGAAREVSLFGFCFNWWPDEYDWRPTLLRMDKGFVPKGTEVMDMEPPFFLAKYDYKPHELLSLLKGQKAAGRTEWQEEAVVNAINAATPAPVDPAYPNARSYEELIRQATWGYWYAKGYKTIRTYHLYAKEVTGKVSHYVVAYDANAADERTRLLYENLDQFDSMTDAVNTMVFDFGDGTIHGAWGAGQILYDLANQVEKIRNDSIDNLRLSNKIKAEVPDAKNVNDVKLSVNETIMVVSGAKMAGNTAGIPLANEGYAALDARLTQLAQEKIGAYVPPIPLQPSDIKAAQVNAALMKEQEQKEALLENWLIQFAFVMKTITKRLCNPNSPDEDVKKFLAKLAKKLTAEEVGLLVNQFPVQSVADFTEYMASKRAAFASTCINNPLFRQSVVARIMAAGVGNQQFVDEICVPEGDQSDQIEAQRQQLMENAALALGQPVPVLPKDSDWVHMQTMQQGMQQTMQSGNHQLLQLGLQHYAGHYTQGVQKKSIPDNEINNQKQIIAQFEKAISALQQKEQLQKLAQMGIAPSQLTGQPAGQATQ